MTSKNMSSYNLNVYTQGKTCYVTSSDVYQNFACTGAVADNGWKADY